MSSNLLKIEAVQTPIGSIVHMVSAKALHERLGVKRDFSTWIKGRIDGYGFEEGVDYFLNSPILVDQKLIINPTRKKAPSEGSGGDHKSQDYNLLLDMAKELAMLEKNDAGRAARKYFIACEAQLHQEQGKALAEQTRAVASLEGRLTAKITDLSTVQAQQGKSWQTFLIEKENADSKEWAALTAKMDGHQEYLDNNELYLATEVYIRAVRLESLKKTILQYDGIIAALKKKPTDTQKSAIFAAIYTDTASLYLLVMRTVPFNFESWHAWKNGKKGLVLEAMESATQSCWEAQLSGRD